MTTLDKIIENFSEESFLKADGFDSAVIGYDVNFRLIYSVKKCIDILVSEGMSEEDAFEHFDYNVAGSYVGEKTPIWCNDYL
jgi:hypothetical protein